MEIGQNLPERDAPRRDRLPNRPSTISTSFQRDVPSRPAFASLVTAMARLSRPMRNEVARIGRKARAAKLPRIRRLTREAAAEARRLAREAAQ
jgi:predicted signal transduction protein with EAL and GGDEF domain